MMNSKALFLSIGTSDQKTLIWVILKKSISSFRLKNLLKITEDNNMLIIKKLLKDNSYIWGKY